MLFRGNGAFLRSGPRHHTSRSIETGAIIDDGSVVDYRAIDIHVADHSAVDVGDYRIVAKDTARPGPADEVDPS
jgi:hypothetical protein